MSNISSTTVIDLTINWVIVAAVAVAAVPQPLGLQNPQPLTFAFVLLIDRFTPQKTGCPLLCIYVCVCMCVYLAVPWCPVLA